MSYARTPGTASIAGSTSENVQPAAVVVTTTVEREEDATRIADHLLSARVAACVQVVGPITSHYRWRDELTTATEWLLLCKTTAANADAVTEAITRVHPYDVPEVLVTPVLGGHPAYLEWLAGEVNEVI